MIYMQEAKYRELAKLLSNYDCIFMDTCSLMEESFLKLMDSLSILRKDDYWTEQITVLSQCIDELKKHSKARESNKRIDAKSALKIIHRDRWHDKIIKIDESTKAQGYFADKVLFNLVNDLRTRKRILVITQDKKLAFDLRSLNHLGSQKGRTVDVYKIRPDGTLEPNYGENEFGYEPRFNGPKNNQKFEKQQQNQVKKPFVEQETTQKDDAIYSEDRRLSANISNPNYEKSRKIDDINKQIDRLSNIHEKALRSMKLAFTLEQLKSEKRKLLDNEKKPLPSRKELYERKEKEIVSPKPFQETKHIWTERGRNASFAFERLGEHYGWFFRDPSVPFVKGVHGDYDLTAHDLSKMDQFTNKMKAGEKKDLSFKTLSIHVEREENVFVLSLNEKKPVSLPKKEEQKLAPSPKKSVEVKPNAPKKEVTPKKEEKPNAKSSKKAVASPKKEDLKTGSKGVQKSSLITKAKATPKAPIASDDGFAALPPGITISVGGPRERKKFSSKDKPQTLEETNALKKKNEKVSTLHRLPETASKKAPASKGVSKRTPSANFADAMKGDRLLNANINNPNYSKENKIKDIEFQIALIRTLKKSETQKLLLGLSVLEKKLKELKK